MDTYSECLELIQTGAVDAVSTDDVILTGMIIQDDTLELKGEGLTRSSRTAPGSPTATRTSRSRGESGVIPGVHRRRPMVRDGSRSGSGSTPAGSRILRPR